MLAMDSHGLSTTCVCSIDQGTQSSRFLIYNMESMDTVSHASTSVQQIYPQAGWVEQDPVAVWSSVVESVCSGMGAVSPCRIVALGIANQRETTVVWDKETGEPLYNAIVWNDDRTTDICQRIAARLGGVDVFRETTGLPISTYFSMYKLLWMIENVKCVADAVEEGRCMFGTVDCWIVYKLTGHKRHCIDVTNASRTGLMNLRTLSWEWQILEDVGISQKVILPEIVSSAECIGHVETIECIAGVPITGCLGDQQASMLGHQLKPNCVKNTYGTGCFVMLNTGESVVQSNHGLLSTVAYQLGRGVPPIYALEGSIGSAGQGISWLKDSLKLIQSHSQSEEVASEILNCGGVIFVPAFSGLLAPWWSSTARASVFGMTYSTQKSHIVRAMLAAICFQTKDVLDAMASDYGVADAFASIVVDGGASSNDVLMQMQSDVLGMPVKRAPNSETTAVGAAIAAGIGAGIWRHEDALSIVQNRAMEFSPMILDRDKVLAHYQAWRKAVSICIGLGDEICAHATTL